MKGSLLRPPKVFVLSLFAVVLCTGATAQSRPAPAGQQELRKYESTQRPEAPQPLPHRINPAQLQREADELSSLAQTVPPEINSVTKGTLPKDLLQKLKRIEKLSKHLRGEVAP